MDDPAERSWAVTRWLAIVGLLIAWGLPQLGIAVRLFPGESIAEASARELCWWLVGLVVILWVLRAEQLPLSSIGLRRPTAGTFGWGLAFAALMIASVMLCYAILFPLFGLHVNQQAVSSITSTPLWLQCAIMIRAGVVEEIIYRGYPIERLTFLSGQRWLAAILSAFVFVIVHLTSWGGAQLLVVAFGAALLTILYLWRRDLMCCMLAHALTDLIGFGLARAQG